MLVMVSCHVALEMRENQAIFRYVKSALATMQLWVPANSNIIKKPGSDPGLQKILGVMTISNIKQKRKTGVETPVAFDL